ncbi:MAG TPA: GNAT family N-acetyltransferase [Polyangiaceae bacterium]|jgi:ribosomal protein S18 acetylase RimI-like enzyme
MHIRPARDSDYETFVALFAELETGDPVPNRERFIEDIAPGVIFAEDDAVLGYSYFHVHDGNCHVRHLVTASGARRRGVGRALLRAVRERARSATWCLNVKRDNVAAIALYESEGFSIAYESAAFRFDATALARIALRGDLQIRAIDEAEDAAVERAAGMRAGSFALGRARKREPIALEEKARVVGGAVFDAHFPGAFPFRVTRADLAAPFARMLAERAGRDHLFVTCEAQRDVTAALVAAGATLRFEMFHMRGELA